jgi:hypothetical protein
MCLLPARDRHGTKGFDRFDYLLDEKSLEIKPFQRSEDEKFGVMIPDRGSRRCIVVVPKKPAKDNPWSWQGCYWNHEPQAEVELLRADITSSISANFYAQAR